MRRLAFLLALALLAFAQSPKTKREPYDPDKLPPAEVACGRPSAKRSVPCDCMKHRQTMIDRERQKCDEIADLRKNRECHALVDACPAVSDAERTITGADGTPMPKVCKRSCRLAKCECCHT